MSDKSTTDLPKELISLLEQYRKAVIDSNICSEQMSKKLSDDLLQSTIISVYKSKSGGHTEKIWNLIPLEKRRAFYENLLVPLSIISFEAEYGGFTKISLTIKFPDSVEQINELKSEIDSIFKKHADSEEGKNCILKLTQHIKM